MTDQNRLYNFIDELRGTPLYPCECGKCTGDKPVCPKVLAKKLTPFIIDTRRGELDKAIATIKRSPDNALDLLWKRKERLA